MAHFCFKGALAKAVRGPNSALTFLCQCGAPDEQGFALVRDLNGICGGFACSSVKIKVES